MRFMTPQWQNRRGTALDLFDEMERIFSELNTTQNRQAIERTFNPAVDVEEAENHFLVTVDLPGIKKEDIKIEMNDNVLTVSGERQRTTRFEDKEKAQRFERSYGSFTRSFTLPTNVAADKIEAQYENGVLHLYLPKTQLTKARKIEIQAAQDGGFLNRLSANDKKESEEKSTNTPH